MRRYAKHHPSKKYYGVKLFGGERGWRRDEELCAKQKILLCVVSAAGLHGGYE